MKKVFTDIPIPKNQLNLCLHSRNAFVPVYKFSVRPQEWTVSGVVKDESGQPLLYGALEASTPNVYEKPFVHYNI